MEELRIENSESPQEIEISTEFIKLDSFVKYCGEAATGAEAKQIITDGDVKVNGDVCSMRGKKLTGGDKVEIYSNKYMVIKK